VSSNSFSQANSIKGYELIGVICHKGTQASSGHYISFCKDDKQTWWSLDDTKIMRVDRSVITGYIPYLIFYQMIQ
jgi:ubiquitin C-terminal hydrolase